MGVDATCMFESSKRLSEKVRELIIDVGIKEPPGSLGVQESDISRLAELSMKDNSTSVNPRTIDLRGFETLYRSILEEN